LKRYRTLLLPLVFTLNSKLGNITSDFKSRLLDEQLELSDRIKKLSSFISSDNFENLDSTNAKLLDKQLKQMRGLNEILVERICILG